MTLDALIMLLALALGVFSRSGLLVFAWLAINILILGLIDSFDADYYWQSMALWSLVFALKDFGFMALSHFLRLPVVITICFSLSCLFHQVLRWQILSYNYDNLTLLEFRPDFMLYLSVFILTATIYDTIGGGNGGKRAKHFMPNIDDFLNRFLCMPTCKVEK